MWKGCRRLSGRNVFSGYISGRWRDFLQRIDQKPKAVWSCTFSSHRSGPLERFFRKGLTKSRKLSGGNIFSGYISKGWSGFSQRISPKLEAAWPERLFRAQFRRLVGLFAGYRPKAEGCLELYFFGVLQRVAGEASWLVGKGSRKRTGAKTFFRSTCR